MGIKPQDGEIFDDAFELYIQSIESEFNFVEGPGSASSIKICSKVIKTLSLGEHYKKIILREIVALSLLCWNFKIREYYFLGMLKHKLSLIGLCLGVIIYSCLNSISGPE